MRALILLSLLAVLPAAADAHAFLKSSDPPVGSVLAAAPSRVTIDFTEDVEAAFSHIIVQDKTGIEVESGKAGAVAGEPARLVVGLKTLPPGAYKVIWRVTSTDTHKTQGSFSFTVAP